MKYWNIVNGAIAVIGLQANDRNEALDRFAAIYLDRESWQACVDDGLVSGIRFNVEQTNFGGTPDGVSFVDPEFDPVERTPGLDGAIPLGLPVAPLAGAKNDPVAVPIDPEGLAHMIDQEPGLWETLKELFTRKIAAENFPSLPLPFDQKKPGGE